MLMPFRLVNVGSLLKLVNRRANMFLLILISIASSMFPVLTFVMISLFMKNPETSSVVVMSFFSPRLRLPSIIFLPFFVSKAAVTMYTPAKVFLRMSACGFIDISNFSYGFNVKVLVSSKRTEENVAVMFSSVVASLFWM